MKLRTLSLAVGVAFVAILASGQETNIAPALPCNGPSGALFNLEPRANAVAQNQSNVDFLLNRVGPNEDLIVQVANDFRANVKSAKWDGSVSGYYVHSSTTADCSVQFEGGLPTITSGGTTFSAVGSPVVAADPARDAFFIADARSGPISTQAGVGLFRAAVATLLNPSACPSGTHTATQAAACWKSTAPQLILPQAGFGENPQVAVDERLTSVGKGAGDVYVATEGGAGAPVFLAACTNSLSECSSAVSIGNLSGPTGMTYMRVREDGVITLSFANASGVSGLVTDDIFFATCTPNGAPNPPTCSAPTMVQHVANPISSTIATLFPIANINMVMFTYPKHASRAEAGGKFTTFLVYDDCKSPFQFQKPPTSICVDTEVVMVTSSDDGKTWSSPVSIDKAPGHHFYPAIATDTSKEIVNLAYYSAGSDPFNHEVQVMRSQITPGHTSPGPPVAMTTTSTAIDLAPQRINQGLSDFFFGLSARGNSISGLSHLYASFDSTAVAGTYRGKPLPELTNHISLITY